MDDAYGRPTEASFQGNDGAMPATWAQAIAQRNVLRYAGYVYDAHAGLYYLQRRSYDPLTRQFLSRDPLRSDGDESPYQYCAGDPLAATDPWGLYVTASGERDDPEIYVPQTGYVVAKGVGSGHHGALGGDTSDLYLPWQGSLGKLSAPGLASRALQGTGEFLRTGLELAAFLCMDPYAHHFGDDLNVENGAAAALMFVDPALLGRNAATTGGRLLDDVGRGVWSALRGTSDDSGRATVAIIAHGDDAEAARQLAREGALPGHEVLDLPDDTWTRDLNDQWVDSVVSRRMDVYVGSNPTHPNMWNDVKGRETIFGREYNQFIRAGYRPDYNWYLRAPR